jgi:hypothetical protein
MMVDRTELLALARTHARSEFAGRATGHYLVIETALPGQEHSSFSTQMFAAPRRPTLSPPGRSATEVLAIAKAAGNPYPDRVSVGRTRNCDVHLSHPTVSKLHAQFKLVAASLELVDAGSHNGTRLNGRILEPHRPVPVTTGDLVRFGNVVARVLDGAGLYDLLR